MTFDEWWDNLSTREQRSIGEHNARFVWESARQNQQPSKTPDSDPMPLFDDWDLRWQK